MWRIQSFPSALPPVKGRSLVPHGTGFCLLLHYKAASYSRNQETIIIQSVRKGDHETGHRLSGRLYFSEDVLSCREYF